MVSFGEPLRAERSSSVNYKQQARRVETVDSIHESQSTCYMASRKVLIYFGDLSNG
jgi:hypothetical protein